jgi:hypothetical protein
VTLTRNKIVVIIKETLLDEKYIPYPYPSGGLDGMGFDG